MAVETYQATNSYPRNPAGTFSERLAAAQLRFVSVIFVLALLVGIAVVVL